MGNLRIKGCRVGFNKHHRIRVAISHLKGQEREGAKILLLTHPHLIGPWIRLRLQIMGRKSK